MKKFKSPAKTTPQKSTRIKSLFRSPFINKSGMKSLKSPFSARSKLIPSVSEIDEYVKNPSDEEDKSFFNCGATTVNTPEKLKGILALTPGNLRKLDLKNQVSRLILNFVIF